MADIEHSDDEGAHWTSEIISCDHPDFPEIVKMWGDRPVLIDHCKCPTPTGFMFSAFMTAEDDVSDTDLGGIAESVDALVEDWWQFVEMLGPESVIWIEFEDGLRSENWRHIGGRKLAQVSWSERG